MDYEGREVAGLLFATAIRPAEVPVIPWAKIQIGCHLSVVVK
jgi:hypothetical protein